MLIACIVLLLVGLLFLAVGYHIHSKCKFFLAAVTTSLVCSNVEIASRAMENVDFILNCGGEKHAKKVYRICYLISMLLLSLGATLLIFYFK
jgi:uncharacterized protein YqgC (DUF456 family)